LGGSYSTQTLTHDNLKAMVHKHANTQNRHQSHEQQLIESMTALEELVDDEGVGKYTKL
jgi:hypothetical protein